MWNTEKAGVNLSYINSISTYLPKEWLKPSLGFFIKRQILVVFELAERWMRLLSIDTKKHRNLLFGPTMTVK